MPVDLADPYKSLPPATLTALRAMEARAKAPRRQRKAKATRRKPELDLPPPPQPDSERMAAKLAEIQALFPVVKPSRPPLGPDYWAATCGTAVTTMDAAPREGRKRVIRRLTPAT